MNQSFVGLFNPFAVKTLGGFFLTISQGICKFNLIIKIRKQRKERVQNQAKPCVFQEETMQEYIKRQNWLLENQELF